MVNQIISSQVVAPYNLPNNPQSDFVQGKDKKSGIFIKIILLSILPICVVIGLIVIGSRSVSTNVTSILTDKEILLSFPMQDTNWQDLGSVFEPVVTLQIKTKNSFKENKFLLDSGAVISSLPREWADETGQDLAFLPRSTFRGFGNTQSFAYQGEVVVLLGNEEVKLPVVFTEAVKTKSLLGRKGFFENYSVVFDHEKRVIEIRR